ncbi:MAG: transcription-repair coupling factor [Bacillota bacterium]
MPHLLLEKWQEDPDFISLSRVGQEEKSAQLVTGLEGSQRSLLIAAVYHRAETAALILTADMARAERLFEEMKGLLPLEEVCIFPPRDFFYAEEVLTQSTEISRQRLQVMERLARSKKVLIIAPVAALLSTLVPAEHWKKQSLYLKKGDTVDWKSLLSKLVEMGYERAELTESEGFFSVRGDIIDIFPFHTPWPIRLSFFAEELESLRCFDAATQRTRDHLGEIQIFPAREVVLDEAAVQAGSRALRAEMEIMVKQLKKKKLEEAADRLRTRVENKLLKLESGGSFDSMEQYLAYFYPETAVLADYFPARGLLFWDEPEKVEAEATSLIGELQEYQAGLLLQGDILPGQVKCYTDLKEVLSGTFLRIIAFSTFSRHIPHVGIANIVNIQARSTPSFLGRLDLLQEELQNWWSQGHDVFLVCDGEERGAELQRLLGEHGLPVFSGEGDRQTLVDLQNKNLGLDLEQKGALHPPQGETKEKSRVTRKGLALLRGHLENGFIIPSLKLTVLIDREILPGRRKKKRWTQPTEKKSALLDFQELKVGDLVVHEQHGIGRYMGMRTLDVDGVTRDFFYIKYSGEDKLFLPVDQLDNLQKYVGGEGRPPRVYSLGGQEWARVKNRVRASVQELAKDLLSLYAEREAAPGYAFSPDHPWQAEFEDRFPFEETPDQLRTIAEVKADMERGHPMDRLLCGDVGYGKTEVALRAAFKAVMDGKQVAFLVPTTILGQQHYNNFKERFQGFPVEIDLLSRFRSAKGQKEIIKRLAAGVTDIVIGTHRLLSKDVKFKDLGLLIIDEEHRFGVRHKEKLKMLRREMDVLSMTATPIPRTMHMAISGARDLSIINTPPENRYPVQTYVVEYTDNLAREAVQRELHRGGQVYFVYNRVQTIDRWAQKLRELVPDARICVGHGQMREQELEKVMSAFLQGKYDILVSTTIVEAGLDIPNVNTMIIYDADYFGLAQLYQLRGRVGRSNRLAYCYLTYRRDKVMTEDAAKRLQAVKEFTELGSGFKIALRDLEIRGAGNILGPEQHGFMIAIGYELYCRLLEQAIETMQGKGEAREKESAPRLDLQVNAYLPSSYVPNQQQKIELYRRIATLESKEELQEMAAELRDRYGRLQPPVENLLLVMHLRQLARAKEVEAIEQQKEQTLLRFAEQKKFEGEQLWKLVNSNRRYLSLHAGKKVTLKLKYPRQPEKQYLQFMIKLLENVF